MKLYILCLFTFHWHSVNYWINFINYWINVNTKRWWTENAWRKQNTILYFQCIRHEINIVKLSTVCMDVSAGILQSYLWLFRRGLSNKQSSIAEDIHELLPWPRTMSTDWQRFKTWVINKYTILSESKKCVWFLPLSIKNVTLSEWILL